MATELFNYFLNQPKLTVINHKFEGAVYAHFGVTDQKSQISGFGGASDPELAQTKAVFELIERTVFRAFGGRDLSSSGWAAHSSLERARENARFELIERDAILCSWFLKIAPKLIKIHYFETFDQDFPIFQFGYSEHFIILGAIVKLKGYRDKMFLSTTCKCIKDGCEKLVIDSERAKALLTDSKNFDDAELLYHHKLFCGLPETELSWIHNEGRGISYIDDVAFQYREFEIPLWNNSKAFVVKAVSDDLQKLFFGENYNHLNCKRLKSLNVSGKTLNTFRHPIL